MLNENEAGQIMGTTAYGSDGDKIGKIGQVYLDDHSGEPQFLTVNTGLFGTSESFVPAQGATFDGDRVTLGFSKEAIKGAPSIDVDNGHLDVADEERLFQYYDMSYSGSNGTDTGNGRADVSDSGHMTTPPAGHDTSGPSTDDAMTRSEERLTADTETREAGRARLRKYVTTEQESVTVPVRKERVVLESEPITGSNVDEATGGPAISEEEHEVVLHEEHAVTNVVAEPVERVRLGTETTVEDETVSGEVRKENIDVDGDADVTERRT